MLTAVLCFPILFITHSEVPHCMRLSGSFTVKTSNNGTEVSIQRNSNIISNKKSSENWNVPVKYFKIK